MKQTTLAVLGAAALGVAPLASATNWVQLQNSEAPGAPAYKFWGFIEGQFIHNTGGAVEGLGGTAATKAYNGQTPLFNLVAPDQNSQDQAQIFRARPGLRGVIPGTDGKINYFVLGEFGNNGLTRAKSVVFSDATVSFNYLPGARVRVGLGRLPLGEEAMLGDQALDYINFTNVTDNLLNERFVQPYSTTQPTSPILGVPLTQSQVTGGVSGYRDTGVEVYDWFKHGKWEYTYALMLSNGNGINFSDNNGSKDLTGRLQASYVFGGGGPKREDVSAFIWHQQGKRTFAGTDYTREREGIGFKYLRNVLRFSGEYIQGKGMIFIGPNPPFNNLGGSALDPGSLIALADSNKASGYYLETGWRFLPKWEADLRYDYLDRLSNSAYDERKFSTWTLGAQYFYSPAVRVQVNYAIRKLDVPADTTPGSTGTSTAATKTQLDNAQAIANAMGNVLSVQLTWSF